MALQRKKPADCIETIWEDMEFPAIFCPHCGIEQGEHPDNLLDGDSTTDYECDECSELFTLSKVVTVAFYTEK